MSRREGVRAVKGRSTEGEGRVVPLPQDAAERIRRHMDESHGVVNLDGFLFTTRTGRPISYLLPPPVEVYIREHELY